MVVQDLSKGELYNLSKLPKIKSICSREPELLRMGAGLTVEWNFEST